jgi:hypothetical protein
MKRLKTMSISNPQALAKQMHRCAWGSAFWKFRQMKFEKDQQRKMMERVVIPMLRARAEAEEALPGERASVPMVH